MNACPAPSAPRNTANALARYAAIDIGTVTTRLLVAACDGTQLQELARRAIITDLGEDVDATGVLKPQAMERVFAVVEQYLAIIHELDEQLGGATGLVAVATSASRDARNSDEFVRGLARRGVQLTVIPGEREAALSFMGAAREYQGEPLIVTDVGGGSTEIIAGVAGGEPQVSHSFNIGCRRMTERYFQSDPPSAAEIARARAWVREQFEPFFATIRQQGFCPARVISVAGTATSMVSVRDRMETYDPALVHGKSVSAEDLQNNLELFLSVPLEARKHLAGLQPERAGVVIAGVIIQQEILACAQRDSFIASESDILQGLIVSQAQAAR